MTPTHLGVLLVMLPKHFIALNSTHNSQLQLTCEILIKLNKTIPFVLFTYFLSLLRFDTGLDQTFFDQSVSKTGVKRGLERREMRKDQ